MTREQVSWNGNNLPSWRVGQGPVCFLRLSVSGYQRAYMCLLPPAWETEARYQYLL